VCPLSCLALLVVEQMLLPECLSTMPGTPGRSAQLTIKLGLSPHGVLHGTVCAQRTHFTVSPTARELVLLTAAGWNQLIPAVTFLTMFAFLNTAAGAAALGACCKTVETATGGEICRCPRPLDVASLMPALLATSNATQPSETYCLSCEYAGSKGQDDELL
jgi:hypothetical protein